MAEVIRFEEVAVAKLRDRLGAVETANADLIAYARGHHRATNAIHDAVLAILAAEGVEDALQMIVELWPGLLGIDRATVALVIGDTAYRVDVDGTYSLEPQWVERAFALADPVALRTGDHGDALFGAAARDMKSEAIIRIGDRHSGSPFGVLLLGEERRRELPGGEGTSLLAFLGRSLGAMIGGWTGTNR
ncbi:DUF484 family protein [Sphingomicrobium clamense]|uniref:DUF484 family protein n=1 Tax=Sphingomicrobium clamense TaxID=2851013 RepID=A0ABS6V5J3_9SPHN|nr:DUF484 family protein [Sphingomicrobium sp. B8]MBW0144761.1 DUF484 family protein [Sphingomicrobium sp. B8]